ncbi:MAG: InlB B-repeat-containing protein [Clostridia bacterium]|nr:InlB B-repeat-containing protein [Clostridia bacterium]
MKKAKKSLALFISVLVFVSAFTAMLALADGTEVIWSNSFETEEERLQWSFIDSDGDGNNWMWKSSDTNASYTAYDGKYSMYSESRTPDREALFPDNISISEEITIKETDAPDLRISWFVAAQDFGRANEHYSVYVIKGLDSVDAIESYQPVFSETLTENVLSYHSRSVDITKTVDDLLDGTEEKTIRIVFRHYDVSDVYALKIDAVSLEAYYNYDMLAEYDFEDGLQGWTTIDGDGDGHNWEHKISSDGFDGYLSEGCIASASYGSEALYPENYIVSPEINISKKYSLVKLSWYDGAYNDSYFDEHYSVYVYSGTETLTKNNISEIVSELTPIENIKLAKSEYNKHNLDIGNEYAGKAIKIIFVHLDDSDGHWLKIDNVTIKAYDGSDPITSITVSDVTAPAPDEIPVTGKIETVALEADGDKAEFTEANLTWQKKVGEEYVDLEEGATFETGTVYRANVTVTVGEDYIFTDDTAVTFNNVTNLNVASVDESLRTATASYDFAPFYTVTWDVDGVKTVDTYTEGSEITAYANPVKEGYSFAGWGVEKLPETMPAENLTFTAAWTVNSYIVTWDNEGTKTEVDYDYNEEIVLPEEPTKTGYTFGGWNGYTEGMKMPAEDKTFTAVWNANKYPATFNANDGAFADGKKLKTIPVAYDSDIVFAEEPVRAGYEFNGWTPTVGKMDDVNGKTFEAVWAAKEDIVYTIETYIMDTTGAHGEPAVETKTDGVTDTTVSVSPEEKEGFTFDAESSVLEAVVAADGSTTLKVYYIRNQYTFTTDVDGTKTSTDYYYEATIADPADPVKEGYTFNGWDVPVPATMPAEAVTVTATWTINKHDVIYMVDNVEYSVVKDVEYGTLVTPIAAPEAREGYTFSWDRTEAFNMPDEDVTINGEWSLTEGYSEYTVEIYLMDEDGNYSEATPTDVIKKATETDAKVTVSSENHSQEAYYIADGETEHEITVTSDNKATAKFYFKRLLQKIFYNDSTAQTTPSDAEYYYGKEYNIPAHREETREGYTFNGWKDDVTGETIPVGEKVTASPATDGEEKIYTADWSVETYKVIWDIGGEKTEVGYEYGAEITAPEIPEKEGHTIVGWDKEIPATMTDIGENGAEITYTAVWEAKPHIIIWKNDGFENIENVVFGQKIDVPVIEEEKTGYSFAGWKTEDGKTPDSYTDGVPDEDLVFTAQWVRNTYKFEFVTYGGTSVDAIEKPYGDFVSKPADPEKIGHTFIGWALKENPTEADKIEIPAKSTMPAENRTYYAIWQINRYTITFADTGDVAYEAITQDYDTAIDTVADPVKTGYSFAGWDVEIPATMPAEDMTITAIWTINQYTITFVDTGDVAYEAITQDYNTAIAEVADPVKTGYTFKGWDTEIPATMPAKDMTVTATWEANSYDATFLADGGVFEENGKDTYVVSTAYDSEIIAPKDPTKTGYTFGGWTPAVGKMDSVDGKTFTAIWNANGDTAYTVSIYTMDTEGNYGEPEVLDFTAATDSPVSYGPEAKEGFTLDDENNVLSGTVAPDGSTNLVVYYIRNQYTFKTVVDGKETTETYYFDEAVTAPADPSKTGHTFDGWDGEVPAKMPANDVTLTVKWSVNTYTVTWNVDGKTTETKVAFGKEITALAAPSKEGYTFKSWEGYTKGMKMPAKDVTFKATWSINTYKVTWVADGKTVKTEDYKYGTVINKCAAPAANDGFEFVGWKGYSDGMKMPSKALTFTAEFKCVATIGIVNNYNGSKTIDYGDILVLHAEGEIPEGATVEWYVNGEKKGTGDEFRFTGDKDATITVKLVKNGKVLKDADGNEISEKEEVKVNAGFFKKIISFFKNLFGINREKFN